MYLLICLIPSLSFPPVTRTRGPWSVTSNTRSWLRRNFKEVTDEREGKEVELKKFGKREIWPPIQEYRNFLKQRYVFKLQGLGISIYDSTRVVLGKVLESCICNSCSRTSRPFPTEVRS